MGESTKGSAFDGSCLRTHRSSLKTVRRTVFLTLRPSRVRFSDLHVHSYSNEHLFFTTNSDSWGNRTPVTGVRGRCLNRLTNEPWVGPRFLSHLLAAVFAVTLRTCSTSNSFSAPSGTRTRDTLIKSQVLYQLS